MSSTNGAYRALVVAAAVLGAAFAFSPLTVLFVVAMSALFRYAVDGLEGRERRCILGILLSALGIRMIALLFFYVTTDPQRENFRALFGDAAFSIQRSLWILSIWNGVEVGPYNWYTAYETYGNIAFDRVLAALQWFIGPAPHALPLLSVAAFFAGVVLLYREVRSRFGRATAGSGLVVLAFWPSFIAWSISMLKEASVLLMCALAIVAAIELARVSTFRARLMLMVVMVTAVALSGSLRVGGQYFALSGICFGYCAWFAGKRRFVATLALIALIAAGSAGIMTQPRLRARISTAVANLQHTHLAQVAQEGKSYRAADDRFYACYLNWPMDDCDRVSFGEGSRFLLKSTAFFFMAPLPWDMSSAWQLGFLPEQLAWYLLVVFACVGIRIGWGVDPLFTGILTGYCLAAIVIIAPNEGNIGTLIRHRDIIVLFVVWLAALGVVGVAWTLIPRQPMQFIDNNGRLFGWLNIVDAGLLAFVLLLLPIGYTAARVFRVRPPIIASIEPAEQVVGPEVRIRLRGRYFRPLLRAWLGPTGRPLSWIGANGRRADIQGTFEMVKPTNLEIVFPKVPAGQYDLHLYDDTREVALRTAAFTVTLPEYEDRWLRVRARSSTLFDPSAILGVGDSDILRSVPVPDEVLPPDSRAAVLKDVGPAVKTSSLVDGVPTTRWTIESEIDVPVRRMPPKTNWTYMGQPIRLGTSFPFETARYYLTCYVIRADQK